MTDGDVDVKPAAAISLSVFRKEGGPLTKRISLGVDGALISDGSACRMSHGRAQAVSLSNMQDLADLISRLDESEAIALGTINAPALRNDGEVRIVRAMELPAAGSGAISRTLEFIQFRAGEPGLMLLDYDTKGLPQAVLNRVRSEGFEAVLSTIAPDIATASRLWRPSTSSGIRHSLTGQSFEKDGGHLYLAVADAADIPRATRALHQRCWLAGLGHFLVGRAGQLLDRSVIDVAVASPERLVFEGPPQVVPPLLQDARPCQVTRGKLLNTRAAFPDLSPEEQDTLSELMDEARSVAEVTARPIRKAIDDAEVRKLREAGMPETEARSRVVARRQGRLFPHIELHFDDAGSATVGDVLANVAAYDQETLADPLEPDTGRCRAKLYVNDSGIVAINSFARGGGSFRLVADRAVLERIIAASEPGAVVNAVKRVIGSAALGPTDYDAIIAATALRSGAGRRAVRQEFDLARAPRSERSQSPRDNDGGQTDARPELEAPLPGGELGPTLRAVDKLLSKVAAIEPPFRLADGQYGLVRERVPSGLHLLLTEDEETDRARRDDHSPIPAPAQAALVAAEYTDVALEVEQHVRFMRRPKEGDPYPVRIPEAHGKAYLTWKDSELPHVTALVTTPLVLPGRKLFTGTGLDREHHVIFRIPERLHDCMPAADEIDLDYAVDRLDFLMNDWLVDVETDYAGKAAIVAMACQTIQRHLLPERPAYNVDAGQRGGGKTTIVIMVHVAVTGVRPAAAAWADNPDERRKALFAAFMTGVAMIPFDNIPRGTSIRCPHIEASLTSVEKSDRVLQESRIATVSTTPTLVFTGNNISPAGDMASRTLRISLEVNRPDPENRTFAHPDPIGWTLDRRGEILNALFSIMLVPGERSSSKTRFKHWHRLIGAPIEIVMNEWLRRHHAAGAEPFSFQDMLSGSEDDDIEAEGARDLFTALYDRFPGEGNGTSREFKGGEFAALLEYPAKPDPLAADWVEYNAERHRVDALRGALASALAAPAMNGRVTAAEAGYKLRALAGRTVADGDTVLALRRTLPDAGTKKKGSASFWIERRPLS